MFVSSKINFDSLESKLNAVSGDPCKFSKKVNKLISRMLDETSLKRLSVIKSTAQSHLDSGDSVKQNLIVKTILDMAVKVERLKPDWDTYALAVEFKNALQFESALAILESIKNPYMEDHLEELRGEIAKLYRESGETKLAEELEAKKNKKAGEAFESPSEKATTQMGKDFVHGGMDTLRSLGHNITPSHNEMDQALQGLHNMSLTAAGRSRDPSLDDESIEELQHQLAEAERALDVERSNFEKAIQSGYDVMGALSKKQQAMQKVLNLKRALHDKGISQSEEGNPQELINQSILGGFQQLMQAFGGNQSPASPQEDCKMQ